MKCGNYLVDMVPLGKWKSSPTVEGSARGKFSQDYLLPLFFILLAQQLNIIRKGSWYFKCIIILDGKSHMKMYLIHVTCMSSQCVYCFYFICHRYGFVYFNEDTNIQPIIEVSECLNLHQSNLNGCLDFELKWWFRIVQNRIQCRTFCILWPRWPY